MHQYLKAIGFDEFQTNKDVKKVLQQIKRSFTHQTIISYDETADFCEFQKEYGTNVGITLCGELDKDEIFEEEYYFPYFQGSGITSYAEVIVERRIEKEQYVGICEDERVGISLIFHLQNGVEYMKEKQLGMFPKEETSVTFSGLAQSGKILLPVRKNEAHEKTKKEESNSRKQLLNAARSGDQTAIETLTLEDIDTYSQVSRRLISEDVFSIVDTYFMPYGVECDQYSIMGVIMSFETVQIDATGTELYQMRLDVNELHFDVCVPVKEVLGEPEVGRRFKANIWLQGYINF